MRTTRGRYRPSQVVRTRHLVVIGVLVLLIFVTLQTSAIPTIFSSSGPRLLFSDTFNGASLDASKWNTYLTSRQANGHPWTDPRPDRPGTGTQSDCGYAAQYFVPSQVAVDNGLSLIASRTPTSGWCNKSGSVAMFPWRSGVVSTYHHFQFQGGYVSVTMKAPPGDGMWPAVWMLPGPGGRHGDDYEIDLQEGRFAPPDPASETFSWALHDSSHQWGGSRVTGVDLGSSYHTYALNWIAGRSITWYLDGKEMAKLTSKQAPIPNEPMELILDLAVASASTSGWHQPYDSTSVSPAAMQVSSVQVWSAPP